MERIYKNTAKAANTIINIIEAVTDKPMMSPQSSSSSGISVVVISVVVISVVMISVVVVSLSVVVVVESSVDESSSSCSFGI